MQENINKLNEFCKKNIFKLATKGQTAAQKRNATNITTIQQQQQPPPASINQSKISGRKLNFDNTAVNKQVKPAKLNEHGDDSSRLSTEFYQEYFRLMNSLKKEDSSMLDVTDDRPKILQTEQDDSCGPTDQSRLHMQD